MESPDAGEIRKRTLELIDEQSTMTVSTSHEDAPWAAPVYYAYRKSTFYFFSDPSSRHVREALENHKASAAIFHQSTEWKEIRGIQMSGEITPVAASLEALSAVRAYLRKFPFTREFFDPGLKIDLDGFVKRFHVRLYAFRPTVLYYQDNRIRFSFREMVSLE